MEETDLHEQLVRAYLDYFKANEWWERKRSFRAYAAVQQCTRKIRDIAKERNLEIREEKQRLKDKKPEDK